MTTRPNHTLSDDDLHARHLSLAASTQAGSGSYADLISYAAACAEADGLRAEVRRRELTGSFCPDDAAAPAPAGGPVRGLRAAAAVLATPKSTVGEQIRALAPPERPNRDTSGRYWWPSPEACLTWWSTVTAPAKPAHTKRKKRAQPTAEPAAKPWTFGSL